MIVNQPLMEVYSVVILAVVRLVVVTVVQVVDTPNVVVFRRVQVEDVQTVLSLVWQDVVLIVYNVVVVANVAYHQIVVVVTLVVSQKMNVVVVNVVGAISEYVVVVNVVNTRLMVMEIIWATPAV